MTRLTIIALLSATTLSGCFAVSHKPYVPVVTEQRARCEAMFSSAMFNPVRDRVELYATNSPPSRSRLPDYPSKSELPALREFIGLYSTCNDEIGHSEVAVLDQLYALYIKKIMWGEFTNRRYAIINGTARQLIAESNARHNNYMDQQRRNFQTWLDSWKPPKKLVTTCRQDLIGSYTCETLER